MLGRFRLQWFQAERSLSRASASTLRVWRLLSPAKPLGYWSTCTVHSIAGIPLPSTHPRIKAMSAVSYRSPSREGMYQQPSINCSDSANGKSKVPDPGR